MSAMPPSVRAETARRRLRPRWPAGVVLALLCVGCGALEAPPKDEGRCDPEHPCAEGQVCIPGKVGGTRGRCAKECAKAGDCAKGTRCSGRYQKLGSVERFCRQAEGALGASCAAPLDGCQPGLRCFQGRCAKTCQKDAECPSGGERCLPVVVDTMVDKDRTSLFSACLPATAAEGKACKFTGPFCGRGLVCHHEVCTRTCAKDGDCGKGRVCDGALFLGDKREERAKQRERPDVRYCRQGAKKNQPCHHNLDVGCAAGLSCIKFRCRKVRTVGVGKRCDVNAGLFCAAGLICHEGGCRKPCLEDKDCVEAPAATAPEAPAPRRVRRRGRRQRRRRARKPAARQCQPITYQKQIIRVCL